MGVPPPSSKRVINSTFQFSCSLTRNYLTQYEELWLSTTLLRCKMITLPILTTSFKDFSSGIWENVHYRKMFASECDVACCSSAPLTSLTVASRCWVRADDLQIVRKKNGIPASRRHSSTLHMRFGSNIFGLMRALETQSARIHTATKQGVNFSLSFLISCLCWNESVKLGTPLLKTRQTPQGERLENQSYLRNAVQIVPHSLEVLTVQPICVSACSLPTRESLIPAFIRIHVGCMTS